MSREHETPTPPDRRDFLKTAGAAAAGALLLPRLEALAAATPGSAPLASGTTAAWTVRPFALLRFSHPAPRVPGCAIRKSTCPGFRRGTRLIAN